MCLYCFFFISLRNNAKMPCCFEMLIMLLFVYIYWRLFFTLPIYFIYIRPTSSWWREMSSHQISTRPSIIAGFTYCDYVVCSIRTTVTLFEGGRDPDSKDHGANMGPTGGRQDPCGPMWATWTLLSGEATRWTLCDSLVHPFTEIALYQFIYCCLLYIFL